MEIEPLARAGLIYIHVLLSGFALHAVITTDHAVLKGCITAQQLQAVHQRLSLMLAGLWLSGLAVAGLDLGLQWPNLAERPKLLAKLLTVLVLTLNGQVLRWFCFPRLVGLRQAGPTEWRLVMISGAWSTACWLLAAFIGVGRPLAAMPLGMVLQFIAGVLVTATVAALLLSAWRMPALARPLS